MPVSEAPKVAPVAKKFPSYNPHFKTDEEKKEEVTGYSICSSCQYLFEGHGYFLRVLYNFGRIITSSAENLIG